MFSREHSCSQKTDMNRASLSEMMDRGNPWYLTIYVLNWSAVSTAVASFQVGMKCVILVDASFSGDPWQPNDPVHPDGLPFLYG